MIDTLTAPAPIGHNRPPITPYEAIKAHIDDLEMEATSFLDGEPITTEAQAAAVSKLIDDARKAKSAAEEQRKLEAKPFDEGKAAVQALWTPITKDKTGRCDMIAGIAKKALAPWLEEQEAKQRAAAEALRQEAEEKAAAAARLAQKAAPDSLSAQRNLRAVQEEAANVAKEAARADKVRVGATGGERKITLRTRIVPTIADRREVLRHYILNASDELEAWLLDQVQKDCRAGRRNIPGVTYTEERIAA